MHANKAKHANLRLFAELWDSSFTIYTSSVMDNTSSSPRSYSATRLATMGAAAAQLAQKADRESKAGDFRGAIQSWKAAN